MRLGVLGATGSVGRLIVEKAAAAGHAVVAQTRNAAKFAQAGSQIASAVTVDAFAPHDPVALRAFVRGLDAVVFALGAPPGRATRLFSDVTAALLPAMMEMGVRRLVAITGVGAGETRGHGGPFYNWFIFPLFTRPLYADKDRQEALIRSSDLDWTIIRPAPFSTAAPSGPLEVHLTAPPSLQLRRITRDEVAAFVVDELEHGRYVRQAPFIGHR
jgi:putative NADH-flavin reductase